MLQMRIIHYIDYAVVFKSMTCTIHINFDGKLLQIFK